MATISGTTGNETLYGTDFDDIIYGYAGNDMLYGLSGNDWIHGGAGFDWVNGGDGNDTLYSGGGVTDAVNGGNDDDWLYGDSDCDDMCGDAGNDHLFGRDNDDALSGGDGADTIWGELGNDHLTGDSGNDMLYGGMGNDTLWGLKDNDMLYGEDGNDDLSGGYGDDEISGGNDQDTLSGNGGNDTLYGGDGNDLLWYDPADAVVSGGAGFDILEVGGVIGPVSIDLSLEKFWDIESVRGGNFADTLMGNYLDNQIHGDGGNDTLIGGGGTDFISGDDGHDLIIVGNSSLAEFEAFWQRYLQFSVPAEPHRFNIELDYRYDTTGFWTAERRAAAEYAANTWESIITDDFATTPAGTQVTLLWDDPDTSGYQCIEQTITLDHDVDDLIIFMRGNTYPGAASFKLVDNTAYVHDRYTGNDAYQPIASAIDFNVNGSWWIDPTPLDNSDDAANLISATDFITVLQHEMGHSLGLVDRWLRSYLGGSIQSVLEHVVTINGNDYFNGANAVAVYGGLVPLDAVGHVVTADYLSVMESQPTVASPGPSALDAAILKDIGYHISL